MRIVRIVKLKAPVDPTVRFTCGPMEWMSGRCVYHSHVIWNEEYGIGGGGAAGAQSQQRCCNAPRLVSRKTTHQ